MWRRTRRFSRRVAINSRRTTWMPATRPPVSNTDSTPTDGKSTAGSATDGLPVGVGSEHDRSWHGSTDTWPSWRHHQDLHNRSSPGHRHLRVLLYSSDLPAVPIR